jgi:predicted ATP-grasp superfamily ATP-dependent carboligase
MTAEIRPMRIFVYEHVSAGGLGVDTPASLEREGRAMLDAIVADFQHIASAVKKVSGPFSADDWVLVIAPEFDDLLASLSEAVLDAGGRLLGSSPAAIRLTGDKLAMAEHWQARQVPHPRTELFDQFNDSSIRQPWVMKPRFGAGSQATFLIRNRDDEACAFAPAFHECPDAEFIVQQYVPGQAVSVSLLIGKSQTIPLVPARQHLSRDGRFHYLGGSLPIPKALAERAIRLALQAVSAIDGLRGYVGVDLVLGDDGDDRAIEINPRLTTSYLGLRQLCKENLAEMILRMAQGEVIAPPSWHAGLVEFRVH